MKPNIAPASRLSALRPPAGAVVLAALGQAGFALVSGSVIVLVDPFLSPRPERLSDSIVEPSDLVGVTAVLATHEHEDHLDLPAWSAIATTSPMATFVVPEPLVSVVAAAGVPNDRVTGARVGSPIELALARVTPVPARHAVQIEDGYSLGGFPHRPPRFVGYVVELDGARIYHAGDTLADDHIVNAVRPMAPDIALLPINGRDAVRERRGIVGNLSSDEAARMARDLNVKLAVPMHFEMVRGNTTRPDRFLRAMARRHPTASIWVPGTGGVFVWQTRPSVLSRGS